MCTDFTFIIHVSLASVQEEKAGSDFVSIFTVHFKEPVV